MFLLCSRGEPRGVKERNIASATQGYVSRRPPRAPPPAASRRRPPRARDRGRTGAAARPRSSGSSARSRAADDADGAAPGGADLSHLHGLVPARGGDQDEIEGRGLRPAEAAVADARLDLRQPWTASRCRAASQGVPPEHPDLPRQPLPEGGAAAGAGLQHPALRPGRRPRHQGHDARLGWTGGWRSRSLRAGHPPGTPRGAGGARSPPSPGASPVHRPRAAPRA